MKTPNVEDKLVMKEFCFKIQGRMPSLNEYVNVNRGSKGKFFGNQTKKFITEEVSKELLRLQVYWKPFTGPVKIDFEWVEINYKRDPDNVIFAKKFVLDGMVKAGLIPNDGMKNIKAFTDTWMVRPETNGGVYVTVTEVEDEETEPQAERKNYFTEGQISTLDRRGC